MRNFTSIINEPINQEETQINEFMGAFLAIYCLSVATAPLLAGLNSGGGEGGKKSGGSSFWDFLIARQALKAQQKAKEDEKSDKKDSKGETPEPKPEDKMKVFNDLLLLSRKANQSEKDETVKKKNDAMIKILTACSFDENGEEIPIEDRLKKMEDIVPADQLETFKSEMKETYEKVKDDDKFKDAVQQARSKITPEVYADAMEAAKKEAKATLEQVAKEKEDQEKYEQELAKLEEEIKDADDDKKKELIEKLEKIKKNPPQSIVATATGTSAGSGGEPKSKKELKDYTEDDAKKIQDELVDLDETKDKKEFAEKSELLKNLAKIWGMDEDKLLPKIEKGANGKSIQTKVGPQGGKYYRTKGKDGWGVWQSGEPKSTNEARNMHLSNYLKESLR